MTRLLPCTLPLTCAVLMLFTACTETSSSNEEDTITLDTHADTTTNPSDTTTTNPLDATMTDAGSCVLPEPERHSLGRTACDNVRADFDPQVPQEAIDGGWASCSAHTDCTTGTNGRCVGNGHDGWYCTYDLCFADSECGDGVCECEGGFRSDHNTCLASSCSADADCGPGGWCSPTLGDCGDYSGTVGYYCHTCEDECTNDSDCTDEPGTFGGGYCMFNQSIGNWICSYSHCAG